VHNSGDRSDLRTVLCARAAYIPTRARACSGYLLRSMAPQAGRQVSTIRASAFG
jgi:hypothetical protein